MRRASKSTAAREEGDAREDPISAESFGFHDRSMSMAADEMALAAAVPEQQRTSTGDLPSGPGGGTARRSAPSPGLL